MNNKRLLTMITLTSALVLGACSSNEEADPGAEGERTSVSIAWRGQGETDNVERYLENFKEEFESDNSDIEIVLEPITASEGDYFSKIALTMQSEDTTPDIVNEDSFILPADANAGLLKSLDDYVEDWDDWDNFTESLKESGKGENGSIYGIPGTTDSRGIWYNKEVFKNAGLPEDWKAENWEDVLKAAESIKESDPEVIPFAMNVAKANGEAVAMQTFEMLLYGTDETLYDSDTKKWNVNGEGLKDSYKFIDEIMNQRDLGPDLSVAISSNFGSVINQDLLPNGGLGMSLDGNWNIGNYSEGGAVPLDNIEEVLGFTPFPTQDGAEPGLVTMAGGWTWAIPEKAKNPDASWKVIQAMSAKDSQIERSTREGTLTVRDDSAEDVTYLERPLIEPATDALENAYLRPKNDLYPNVSIIIQDTVEGVATGAMTPDEAAETYKTEVIDIVGEDNTY